VKNTRRQRGGDLQREGLPTSQNIFERKRAMSRVRGTQVVATSARPAKWVCPTPASRRTRS